VSNEKKEALLKTMRDVDAGTYEVHTVYQDPRRGVIVDGGKARVYVFSLPDRDLAQKWGEEVGIPAKFWDDKRKRWKVQGGYISEALKLPKAPKKVIEAFERPAG